MWLMIANALISVLGPILMDLFKKWLLKRLEQEAKKLDKERPNALIGSRSASILLLDKVEASLWPWQIGKKKAVRAAREAFLNGSVPDLMKAGVKIG